jgi:hypothetical protein
MGILSAISSAVTKATTAVKTYLTATPTKQYSLQDQLQATIKNPIKALSTPTVLSTKGQTITSIAMPSSSISLGKTITQNVIAELTAKPLKTAAIGVVSAGAATIAGSALLQSPKLRNDVISAPKELVTTGTCIATLRENPSLTALKDCVTKNPVISAAAAAALLVGGAKVVQGFSTWSNTNAMNKNTDATLKNLEDNKNGNTEKEITAAAPNSGGGTTIVNVYNTQPEPVPIAAVNPIAPTPEPIKEVSPTPKPKKKKAAAKKKKAKKKKAKKKAKPKKKSKKYIKKKKAKRKR